MSLTESIINIHVFSTGIKSNTYTLTIYIVAMDFVLSLYVYVEDIYVVMIVNLTCMHK